MNIHIFIDAENVPMANAITTCNVLAEGNDVTFQLTDIDEGGSGATLVELN